MAKINTAMLVSAIACFIAAVGFFLPWAIAYFEETTETRTAFGTPITITLKDYYAFMTGFGTGWAEASGTGSISGVPYSFDVSVNMEFIHDIGYVGIAGSIMSILAFVFFVIASLMSSSAAGRSIGYIGLVFLAIGLGLGLSYASALWIGLGRIKGKAEVEVSVPGYPTFKTEGEIEAELSTLVENAKSIYPGYGLVLALVMWAISMIYFVKGMRLMAISARPAGMTY